MPSNRPKFQRRHYDAVAGVLRAIRDDAWDPLLTSAVRVMSDRCADLFTADNPRFQRDRFIAAVKGEQYRVTRRPKFRVSR